MSYDDWLVEQEHNFRGWNDPEHACDHCEKPIDKKGYCSDNCFEADMM
jgi:hypothetical protein|tara:strand:+ start:1762 stop:1905 length:144 start_codon:yes stop_codon:yes gene_type:complete